MIRPGARGDTAAQMDAVMHGVGADEMADPINSLQAALESRTGTFPDQAGEQHDVTLRIANSAFAQRGLRFEPPYLEALASRFDAGVQLVDYASQAEAARVLINAWVRERTEQRIPELLAKGTLTDRTRLVLANAIYLKAPWLKQFPVGATKDHPFAKLDGSSLNVPMMHIFDRGLRYAEGSGWRAVEVPYVGGELAMTVIVPDDLDAFERGLDAGVFDGIVSGLATREAELAMPKFDIESKAELADHLGGLGMPLAFDPNSADFSGLTTELSLFLAHVIHQANITVDEKGTEAAAATAVVGDIVSAPNDLVKLNVDRPFLFAVRDVPTGAVLFLGRVVDPSLTR
jgi:serpin B